MAAREELSEGHLAIVNSLPLEEIPTKLRCAVCNCLAIKASKISCCGQNLCGDCCETVATRCPVCDHEPVDLSELKAYGQLRRTIKVWLDRLINIRNKAFADVGISTPPALNPPAQPLSSAPTSANNSTPAQQASDGMNAAQEPGQTPASRRASSSADGPQTQRSQSQSSTQVQPATGSGEEACLAAALNAAEQASRRSSSTPSTRAQRSQQATPQSTMNGTGQSNVPFNGNMNWNGPNGQMFGNVNWNSPNSYMSGNGFGVGFNHNQPAPQDMSANLRRLAERQQSIQQQMTEFYRDLEPIRRQFVDDRMALDNNPYSDTGSLSIDYASQMFGDYGMPGMAQGMNSMGMNMGHGNSYDTWNGQQMGGQYGMSPGFYSSGGYNMPHQQYSNSVRFNSQGPAQRGAGRGRGAYGNMYRSDSSQFSSSGITQNPSLTDPSPTQSGAQAQQSGYDYTQEEEELDIERFLPKGGLDESILGPEETETEQPVTVRTPVHQTNPPEPTSAPPSSSSGSSSGVNITTGYEDDPATMFGIPTSIPFDEMAAYTTAQEQTTGDEATQEQVADGQTVQEQGVDGEENQDEIVDDQSAHDQNTSFNQHWVAPRSHQPPYHQDTYGQTPHDQMPYNQTPYNQTPFSQFQFGPNRFGQAPHGPGGYANQQRNNNNYTSRGLGQGRHSVHDTGFGRGHTFSEPPVEGAPTGPRAWRERNLGRGRGSSINAAMTQNQPAQVQQAASQSPSTQSSATVAAPSEQHTQQAAPTLESTKPSATAVAPSAQQTSIESQSADVVLPEASSHQDDEAVQTNGVNGESSGQTASANDLSCTNAQNQDVDMAATNGHNDDRARDNAANFNDQRNSRRDTDDWRSARGYPPPRDVSPSASMATMTLEDRDVPENSYRPRRNDTYRQRSRDRDRDRRHRRDSPDRDDRYRRRGHRNRRSRSPELRIAGAASNRAAGSSSSANPYVPTGPSGLTAPSGPRADRDRDRDRDRQPSSRTNRDSMAAAATASANVDVYAQERERARQTRLAEEQRRAAGGAGGRKRGAAEAEEEDDWMAGAPTAPRAERGGGGKRRRY